MPPIALLFIAAFLFFFPSIVFVLGVVASFLLILGKVKKDFQSIVIPILNSVSCQAASVETQVRDDADPL